MDAIAAHNRNGVAVTTLVTEVSDAVGKEGEAKSAGRSTTQLVAMKDTSNRHSEPFMRARTDSKCCSGCSKTCHVGSVVVVS